jgi:hypothetical protein
LLHNGSHIRPVRQNPVETADYADDADSFAIGAVHLRSPSVQSAKSAVEFWHLFVAEGRDRIDFRRAAGGEIAGEEGDDDEAGGDGDEGNGVVDGDAEEDGAEEAGEEERGEDYPRILLPRFFPNFTFRRI